MACDWYGIAENANVRYKDLWRWGKILRRREADGRVLSGWGVKVSVGCICWDGGL